MDEFIDVIKQYCDESGYEFYEDYSGRGMYGEECVGIVVPGNYLTRIAELCDYIWSFGYGPVLDVFRSINKDTMGMDTILYFPGVKYSEAHKGEDEDEEEE